MKRQKPNVTDETAKTIVELPTVDGGTARIAFPTSDDLVLAPNVRWSYDQDGLKTNHNCDFRRDPKFQAAYQRALEGAPIPYEIHWRAHTCVWAALQGLNIEGDFVECGVYTGFYSRIVCSYLDFAAHKDRHFYLLDTYTGIPDVSFSEEESRHRTRWKRHYSRIAADYYEHTKSQFSDVPNVTLVKGIVPDTLHQVPSEKVAYLSIDMNTVAPEMAAGEFFWPKLSPGAFIVLDDYGFRTHRPQKIAWDAFAKERGVQIFHLPTGQGLLMKPAGR